MAWLASGACRADADAEGNMAWVVSGTARADECKTGVPAWEATRAIPEVAVGTGSVRAGGAESALGASGFASFTVFSLSYVEIRFSNIFQTLSGHPAQHGQGADLAQRICFLHLHFRHQGWRSHSGLKCLHLEAVGLGPVW